LFRSTAASPALVVISPGFQMARTQYTSYAAHLATWGFVVILADYTDTSFFADHQKAADDIRAVITWALARPDLGIDSSKVAATGHSLGGKLSILAASSDPRIKAIVAWDPVDSNSPSVAPQLMGTVGAAIAVIGETTNATGGMMPCAPGAENFQQFYAAARSPALAMTMNGADHMDWVDDPSCAFCGFCTAGTLSPSTTRTATKRLDVAWLRRQLFGDTAMEPWLSSPPELAAGSAAVTRK
jgi:predicted dienelactone hydrolase